MRHQRILLLSVSAGAGHMRAAQALQAQIQTTAPTMEVRHLDVMTTVPVGFRKIYTDFYITLVNKAPAVWSYLYNKSNDALPHAPMQKFRRAIERLNTIQLRNEIVKFNPDAIVCTHFLPAEILSRMLDKERIQCPIWVQVTDFDLHRLWIQRHMSGYFAANEEVAFRMQAHHVAPEKIHVTGIPIMPGFQQNLDRATCAREWGLDPARTTLLLMGGGAGLGSLETIAERLLNIEGDFQLIALAGKNRQTLEALQRLQQRFPQRLLAQGFTDKVERLMACSDLVITKPGGLTTSECLAMGLPMIVNSPIPGQEERNADYLLEQGVALKAFDDVTLEYRVRMLLRQPEQLQTMRERARQIGRPRAAQAVVDIVLAN